MRKGSTPLTAFRPFFIRTIKRNVRPSCRVDATLNLWELTTNLFLRNCAVCTKMKVKMCLIPGIVILCLFNPALRLRIKAELVSPCKAFSCRLRLIQDSFYHNLSLFCIYSNILLQFTLNPPKRIITLLSFWSASTLSAISVLSTSVNPPLRAGPLTGNCLQGRGRYRPRGYSPGDPVEESISAK